MKRVSREYLEVLKESVDIVEIARDLGMRLIKSTSGRFSSPCPLPNHSDQNPSFSLFVESQEFHCFGCHAHGDVVDLVSSLLKVPFHSAIEYLSKKTGLKIEEMDEDEVYFLWESEKYQPTHAAQDDVALFEIISCRNTIQQIASRCGASSDEFCSSFEEFDALLVKLDRATSPAMKSMVANQIKQFTVSLKENYLEDQCDR